MIWQAPFFGRIKHVRRSRPSWGVQPPASTSSCRTQRSGTGGHHTPKARSHPQEETSGPVALTRAPTPAAAPDTIAGPPPAEPAAEGAAPAAEAAAPEAAEVQETAAPEAREVPEATAPEAVEVTSTTAPPAQEEEPEVVLGRRLLPSAAEIPFPRLFARSQKAQEELEAGIRREWERLEAERLRLSDWEDRLGDRIKTVSTRYARKRAELVLGRELLQEQLQQALDREVAAAQRERAAVRREKHALERELAAEKRVQAAADREKTALELANQAKVVVEMTKAQEATLAELEAAAVERERRLAAREAEEVARLDELQEREAAVEKELAAGTWWCPASDAVPNLQGVGTPPDCQDNRTSIFVIVFVI
jgi:hypothetical protein